MKRMNKGMLVWSRLLVNVAAVLVFLLPGTAQSSQEQQTGFFYDAGATDGLTLFASYRAIGSYLVDNSGTVVHRWFDPDGLTAGTSVYLTKAGTLLKGINRGEGGQGDGGLIREYLKDGSCIWEFRYDDETEPPAAGQQHHDIEELPNGNLLLVGKEGSEDTILEIKRTGKLNKNWDPRPEYPGSGNEPVDFDNTCKYILDGASKYFEPEWKWNSGDHRGKGPRKIGPAIDNVNFNHIDFLPARDHILVSCNACNELFIIDHKPNTKKSAGKAGDLLWRWGTPSNYGAEGEPLLRFTHGAHWIYNKDTYGWSGYKDTDIGDIIVLNNRDPQLCDEPCDPQQVGFSSVVQITPPWNEKYKNYGRPKPGVAFEPDGFKRRIVNFSNDGTTFDLDSDFQGSAQLLPHGRMMVSFGAVNNNDSTGRRQGDIYEIQSDQFGASAVSVWRYVNPFVPPEEYWPQNNGPKGEDIELPEDEMVAECDQNNFGFQCNAIFRGIKYAPSFEGLDQLNKCDKHAIHCDFSELYPGVPLTDYVQAAKLQESCYLSVTPSGTTKGTVYANPPINVFDSSDISSKNDPDLGSPNKACYKKGPGRGKGGKPYLKDGKPNPFKNCEPLHNLLIIQNENIDVLDKANDSKNGGCMDFEMMGRGHVKDVGLLDIEEAPGASITFYSNGYEVGSILSPLTGNNGHWRASRDFEIYLYLEHELPEVDGMKICIPGSGAVSFIDFEHEPCKSSGKPYDDEYKYD